MPTTNPNEERSRLQKEALDTLLAKRRLIIEWGTGVGKSRPAIEAIDELYNRGKCRILLLVTETIHKENWRKEFIEAKGKERGEALFNACRVECYASLGKYEYTFWHLIVADEAHHLRGELKRTIFSNIGAEYVLMLTATLSCNGDAEDLISIIEDHFGEFARMKMKVTEAIEQGILAKPKIYVHLLPLEDITERQTVVEEWGPKDSRVEHECTMEDSIYITRLNCPATTLKISCTAKQAYDFLTKKMNEWKKTWRQQRNNEMLLEGQPDNKNTIWAKNRMVHYGSLRKDLLANCKTRFAQWLTGTLDQKGVKYICFCGTVEQALRLNSENVIYADSKQDNTQVVEAFNEDRIRSLYAVNMGQEGANLKGIQQGVILQLGGKDRRFIQEFGRTLRSKEPVQHLVVIYDTRDEAFLETALSGFNEDDRKRYIRYFTYGRLKGRDAEQLLRHEEEKNTASEPCKVTIPGMIQAG